MSQSETVLHCLLADNDFRGGGGGNWGGDDYSQDFGDGYQGFGGGGGPMRKGPSFGGGRSGPYNGGE